MDLVIIDDNKTFTDGLAFFITNRLGHRVVQTFNNPMDFLHSMKQLQYDLILMDIEMPGLNGIDGAKEILWDNEYKKIIAITDYEDQVYLNDLIEAGFKGFVSKRKIFEELELAIKKVMKEGLYFPNNMNIKLL